MLSKDKKNITIEELKMITKVTKIVLNKHKNVISIIVIFVKKDLLIKIVYIDTKSIIVKKKLSLI